jgi:hypothetical protein
VLTGVGNVGLGVGFNVFAALTSGDQNVAVGYAALNAIGRSALNLPQMQQIQQ